MTADPRDPRPSIAVVVPTVDEAATIGQVCRELVGLRRAGWCDRVLVVDESTDGTGRLARAAGADVVRQSALLPGCGPVLGKGDALWRALAMCDEDVVVFVDGDTRGFDPATVRALVAPIVAGEADFVKADYRRPWNDGRTVSPTGGGRVTELTAKPLLRRLFPELAAFGQPLAGELAARTLLLRQLPFVTGYGVDVALLIDAWRTVGAGRVAQVRTPPRQNRHRPLHELAAMADEVTAAVLSRALPAHALDAVERPAHAAGGGAPTFLAAAG